MKELLEKLNGDKEQTDATKDIIAKINNSHYAVLFMCDEDEEGTKKLLKYTGRIQDKSYADSISILILGNHNDDDESNIEADEVLELTNYETKAILNNTAIDIMGYKNGKFFEDKETKRIHNILMSLGQLKNELFDATNMEMPESPINFTELFKSFGKGK